LLRLQIVERQIAADIEHEESGHQQGQDNEQKALAKIH